jgi:hypothetical protein
MSYSRNNASLAQIPVAQRIVAVFDARHDEKVSPLVVELARRDRASVVLFDLSTGSRWSTPFEADDARLRTEDRILSAARLDFLCHHTAAEAVHEMNRTGAAAGAHLSTRPTAVELSDLVRTRHIDPVVALGSLHGKSLRHLERVRMHGAALVQRHPEHSFAVYPPLAIDMGADRGVDFSTWFRRFLTVAP